MEKHSTHLKGKKQEALVKSYLEKKGYLILRENFRAKYGEIDLIGVDSNQPKPVLVFVEVRSASGRNDLLKYSLGVQKRNRFRKMVQYFVLSQKVRFTPIRCDVVWVMGDVIEHWTNVEI